MLKGIGKILNKTNFKKFGSIKISLIICISIVTAFSLSIIHISSIFFSLIFMGFIILDVFTHIKIKIPKNLYFLVALTPLTITLIIYRTMLGHEPVATFLLQILSLKIFESKSRRDFLATIFILLFYLVAVSAEFSTLTYTIVLAFALIYIAGFLLELSKEESTFSLASSFKRIFILLIWTIPIVLILFLIFPRWGDPIARPPGSFVATRAGLTNKLVIGNFSKLLDNDELSFNVQFKGKTPAVSEMYWRAKTLSRTNGIDWFEAIKPKSLQIGKITRYNYDQTFILYPHHKKFLIGLDFPISFHNFSHFHKQKKSFTSSGFHLQTPVNLLLKYDVDSTTELDTSFPPLTQLQKSLYLRYPSRLKDNLKVLKLIEEWNKNSSKTDFINNLLDFFTKYLNYGMDPGILNSRQKSNFLETLLFETRRGVCGHFASAMALLLRMNNIPSRVIIGYQGGTYNSFGNFWSIRQRQAHAWVEAYLNDKWYRFDPTRSIYPERILEGDWENEVLLRKSSLFPVKLYFKVQEYFSGLNNSWNLFLLNFDWQYQKDWLKSTFKWEGHWSQLIGVAILLISSVAILLIFLIWILGLMGERTKPDSRKQFIKNYHTFLKKLSHKKWPTKRPDEGPIHYYNRISDHGPMPPHWKEIFLYVNKILFINSEILPSHVKELKKLIAK